MLRLGRGTSYLSSRSTGRTLERSTHSTSCVSSSSRNYRPQNIPMLWCSLGVEQTLLHSVQVPILQVTLLKGESALQAGLVSIRAKYCAEGRREGSQVLDMHQDHEPA